jgi:hypothetical protein
MLSEFEIVKPNKNFNQLYLDYSEVHFKSIEANLV